MRIAVYLTRMPVLVDPNIIIRSRTPHITIKHTISLTLRTSTALILPDVDVEPVSLFFDVDVVKPVRAVDLAELDVLADIGFGLPAVGEAGGRPFGNLIYG